MTKHILQTICPECGHECWRDITDEDWLFCPECGARLNQQSSEDADEGAQYRD